MRGIGRSSSKGNSDEVEEKILHCEVVKQQNGARKGCGISIFGDIQTLTGQGLEQSELALKLAMLSSGFEASLALK